MRHPCWLTFDPPQPLDRDGGFFIFFAKGGDQRPAWFGNGIFFRHVTESFRGRFFRTWIGLKQHTGFALPSQYQGKK